MVVEDISTRSPEKICIRAPNWVGDVVMATPLFRCVRRNFPSSKILLVIRDGVAPVVAGAPWFDEVLVYRPGWWNASAEFLRCTWRVRRRHCDLGFILPNSFSSALMFFLAGVSVRVGYVRDMRRRLLTLPVSRPTSHGSFQPTYMVDYYLALCEQLGLKAEGRDTELHFGDEDMDRARQILRHAGINLRKPLFLLHPGAGFGPSKLWPEENFARLAELLQDNHVAQLCVIGAPQERPLAQRIVRLSGARIHDLTGAGIDLHLLKCVVALSSLLITTDSGPRHYGVALGVPTVCVMGPTHPAYSTSGKPNDIVVRIDVDCGPCQQKVCKLDHRCMRNITPHMVFSYCNQALLTGGLSNDTH